MEETKTLRQQTIEDLKGKVILSTTGYRYNKDTFAALINNLIHTLEEHFLSVDEIVVLMREYGVDPSKPKPAIPHDLYAKWLTDKYNRLNVKYECCKHTLRDIREELRWIKSQREEQCLHCRDKNVPIPSDMENRCADLERKVERLQRANELLRSSNQTLFDHVIFGQEKHPEVMGAKRKSLMVRIMSKFHCDDTESDGIVQAIQTLEKLRDKLE